MRKDKKINSAILVIGDEILSGRTQDLNVSFLSKWLNENYGITVDEVRIIHDEEQIIIKNIINLSKNFNYVFTTGGIGPTHDDITAKSISKAFKVNIDFTKRHIKFYKITMEKNFNDGRKKWQRCPGSKLIYNLQVPPQAS